MTAIRFDADLVRRYGSRGPRYTSYPPAAQFRQDFDISWYQRSLAASNEDPIPATLSLYVHVPFCASPCFYCACTRVITRDHTQAARYLDYLYREIALRAELFAPDRRVEQLHLGGGTPTFLSTDQLAALLDLLQLQFPFSSEAWELSIEIDPRTVTSEDVAHLASLGFNRMSLGVQDLDPGVQRAVNRIQPLEQVLAVMDAAQAAGVSALNLDLIYGLPGQTVDTFGKTLDALIAARPARIAAYSYAHMPHVFKPQRRLEASALPTPDVKLALLALTIEKLGTAGYTYIGMDHFALPDDELAQALRNGSLHRNFQGYSTHCACDLIGLGMSAIGKVGDVYVQNFKDLPRYYAALDADKLPVWRGLKLKRDDKRRAAVIQALMCQGALDITDFSIRYNIHFNAYFAKELDRLAPLEADGLIEVTPKALRVTPAGRLLLRPIAMAFDACLHDGSAQAYSMAI